eukprot:1608960-Pleurochrysis_carterae.AAC.1
MRNATQAANGNTDAISDDEYDDRKCTQHKRHCMLTLAQNETAHKLHMATRTQSRMSSTAFTCTRSKRDI